MAATFSYVTREMFLDRPAVVALVDEGTRRGMNKAGGLVRKIAQRSMRYVTDVKEQERQIEDGKRKKIKLHTASAPGSPPHAIQPHALIRRFLSYAYDPATKGVVIGVEKIHRSTMAQATHEHGGQVTVQRRNSRRRFRKIGGGGEIRISGKTSRTTKFNDEGVPVTYCRIRTQAQADRANRHQEELYGPEYMPAETLNYPPRPFMGPALRIAAPDLPGLFAN